MKKLLCAMVVLAACGGGGKAGPQPKLNRWGKPYKEGIVVPVWVDKLPENTKGKLVAVGFSQPTYWPQDALNNASEDARGKLALALGSHVETLEMDTATARTTGGGTLHNRATHPGLHNSRHDPTWADRDGGP